MLNPVTGKRELAYIVEIAEIKPLEGYDRVEYARVNGWWCVVGKGMKIGDKAIYFEIDSQVNPLDNRFAFMSKRKYRVKTQRMCKVVSQGLVLPLTDFPEFKNRKVGDFVTEELGVTYYEAADNQRKANTDKYSSMINRKPKVFKNKFVKKLMRYSWGRELMFLFFGKKKDKKTAFPTKFDYIKKTDEERVENMPWILKDKTPWIKTTKIDGTSCTYILERKSFGRREFYVCSRNIRQLTPKQHCFFEDDNVYWEIENKFHIRKFLENLLDANPKYKYVAIQGEGAGLTKAETAIQGNPHKFHTLRFFAFNLIDSENGRWNSVEAANLVKEFNIEWVPIVDTEYILPDGFEEFKKTADGECEAIDGHGLREGYVYRNIADPNKSFKNVSREYLLGQK